MKKRALTSYKRALDSTHTIRPIYDNQNRTEQIKMLTVSKLNIDVHA